VNHRETATVAHRWRAACERSVGGPEERTRDEWEETGGRAMDSVLMRRLRAVLLMMAVWSVPWLVVGSAIGANLMWQGAVMVPHRFFGDVPVILGALGGVIGALTGFGFALLMLFAEPVASLSELREWRVAQWGALSAAIVGYSIFEGIAMTILSASLGLLVAKSAMALARRPAPLLQPGVKERR
jgi:hypothetical protein